MPECLQDSLRVEDSPIAYFSCFPSDRDCAMYPLMMKHVGRTQTPSSSVTMNYILECF